MEFLRSFGGGTREGYGGHGDVLVYKTEKRFQSGDGTPIIHRAMLLIQVQEGCEPLSGNADLACKFRIPETCNVQLFSTFVLNGTSPNWPDYCEGSTSPFTFNLQRGELFLNIATYPCQSSASCRDFHGGFITKGDNNLQFDQPQNGNPITDYPVDLEHIVGKARGEIPWFGLIKLAIYGNGKYGCDSDEPCSDPTLGSQWRVLKAVAPRDLWLGLFIAIALLVAIPIGADLLLHQWRKQRAKRAPKAPPPPSQ